jgi:hypothetical protein
MSRPSDWFRSKPSASPHQPNKWPEWVENMLDHTVPDLGAGLNPSELVEAAKRGDAVAIALVVRRAESWSVVLRSVEREEAAKPVLQKLAEERICWPVIAEFPTAEKWAAQVRTRMKMLRLGARRTDARQRPRDLPTWVDYHAGKLMIWIIDGAERLGCYPNDKRAQEAGWTAWLDRYGAGGNVLNVPGVLEALIKSPGFPERNSLAAWEKLHPLPTKAAPVLQKDANHHGREGAEAIAAMKPRTKWEKDRLAEKERIYGRQSAWLGKQRAEMKRQLLAAAMDRLGQVISDETAPEVSPG